MYFYPRPPRGGRPCRLQRHADDLQISIHALREEGDPQGCRPAAPADISIHALREEGDEFIDFILEALSNFYPRPPRGGRQPQLRRPAAHRAISIHALREEGDAIPPQATGGILIFLSTPSARRATTSPACSSVTPTYFYPRPPRGGRRDAELDEMAWELFLSTPSARRATRCSGQAAGPAADFYPRPPRGGRPPSLRQRSATTNFYPRPPRGGRRCQPRPGSRPDQFLSTPSARRATGSPTRPTTTSSNFYPRPPRGGRLSVHRCYHDMYAISIHALREEGDVYARHPESYPRISIHALREEGDVDPRRRWTALLYFYPRPPRGGRRSSTTSWRPVWYFYPRPPRGGRRLRRWPPCGWSRYFYPRPPRGGRP